MKNQSKNVNLNSYNLPTVSVFVCAYNEEPNIKRFLESVIAQIENTYVLKEILVIDDGSTDNTVQEVEKVDSDKIKLRKSTGRVGKSSLMSDLYKNAKSDFVISTDADIIFTTPNVISEMIKPMINNPKVGMTGGNHIPVNGTTFTEKSINYTMDAYMPLRTQVRGGNNLFTVAGCILGLRKEFCNSVTIPSDMINNDVFTYYTCLNSGWEYRYAEDAVVEFRQPANLRDQIKQNSRFLAGHKRMYRYFPHKLVDRERHIPKNLIRTLMFKEFKKHPIHSVYIFGVNLYCKLIANLKERKFTAMWDMADSTKTLRTL